MSWSSTPYNPTRGRPRRRVKPAAGHEYQCPRRRLQKLSDPAAGEPILACAMRPRSIIWATRRCTHCEASRLRSTVASSLQSWAPGVRQVHADEHSRPPDGRAAASTCWKASTSHSWTSLHWLASAWGALASYSRLRPVGTHQCAQNVELPLFYAAQIEGNIERARDMLNMLGLAVASANSQSAFRWTTAARRHRSSVRQRSSHRAGG